MTRCHLVGTTKDPCLMTVLVGDTMSPGRDDKSEVVVAPPPESVQLRHDWVQTEQIVAAVLLGLQINCHSGRLVLELRR